MKSIFLPERLKKIREDRGLNKAEAARLLGLSKMGYLRYESADRTPSYQTIVFMALKLGTSPDYLTGKTKNSEPMEFIISKSDDPVLFELIIDMIELKKDYILINLNLCF
jgi:transcriptional regulator with XRE-family HTH domain